ncbi:hypothetical protein [Leucobacter chromiireducens]|uniref:hypothetical protein n=1 Tax=Leucobacter chromiireducens TaxID=283877 RepID=UPI000F6407CF|nr:hypothetical protein [Leucobacter chromiireducens]
MLELLLAAYLAGLIPGIPSPIGVELPWSPNTIAAQEEAQREADVNADYVLQRNLCRSRAEGLAIGLSSATHGVFKPLQQAGIYVNPPNLNGDGCRIALTDEPRLFPDADGVEKITGAGPTAYSVVWEY